MLYEALLSQGGFQRPVGGLRRALSLLYKNTTMKSLVLLPRHIPLRAHSPGRRGGWEGLLGHLYAKNTGHDRAFPFIYLF